MPCDPALVIGTLPEPIQSAVMELAARLHGQGVTWALTGSAGFALHGVPLVPHDVDVQSDRDGAYAIERLFAECVVRPVAFQESEGMRSHLGMLKIHGVDVEIMGAIQKRYAGGAWESPVRPEQHTRWLPLGGVRIPVLSLEYEHGAYLMLGRRERAALLRRWMDEHPPVPDQT